MNPSLTSQSIDRLIERALAAHNLGQLSEAEELYQQVLSLDSNHCQALNLLGHLYYQVSDYELAIELVSQAIFIDPDRADLYRTAGKICFATRNFEDAIDAFRQAIDLGDRAAENYDNLIDALEAIELHEDIGLAKFAEERGKTYSRSKSLTHKEVWSR